jgi:hypothetical protein
MEELPSKQKRNRNRFQPNAEPVEPDVLRIVPDDHVVRELRNAEAAQVDATAGARGGVE